MKAVLVLLLLIFSLKSCSPAADEPDKIRGISLVAGRQAVSDTAWQQLLATRADWVSLMPYAFGRLHDSSLVYNLDRQWRGERRAGTAEAIQQAHQRGLRVMLKPHLWLRGGYTGHHNPGSAAGWQAWERHYSAYILDFARLADSLQVDIFCLGTELTSSVAQRPAYWSALIAQVRQVYRGRLTYAANWDAYPQVPFWQQLDYVGIDAYFPLSTKENPTVEELQQAWQPHLEQLREFNASHGQPILITEWGFRSARGATQKPWEHPPGGTPDPALQARAYRAFFSTLWSEPYLAGAFVWKWYSDPLNPDRISTDYSPQAKPAQEVLGRQYSK